MGEITGEYLKIGKRREVRLKILDWLSIICLIGALVSFILEYGGELYVKQSIGFIVGWLTINEVRMRERLTGIKELLNIKFESMRELMNSRFKSLENRLKAGK